MKEATKQLLFDKSFVNGLWESFGGNNFSVLNPANGDIIARVNDAGVPAVHAAIDHAYISLQSWKLTTAKDRAEKLEKWYQLLHERSEELAELMTLECGKPISESRGEVVYGASFIKWFAEEGKRAYGDIIPHHKAGNRLMTMKQPVGVVGVITPWNFPLAMITRKVGAALAAGCTVVVRPSEETPLTALAMASLSEKAGIPAGVFNVVIGSDPAPMGLALCESEKVAKISFTGSTRVGRLLMKQSADTLKKLSLELGGNAPIIIFEDADLQAAVQGTMASKFRNAGQTCVCANRILVQDSIYEQFSKLLSKEVEKLQLGPGILETTTIGPLINQAALEKNQTMVEDAVEKGGSILVGGQAEHDYFFQPTVITNCTSEMILSRQEIFGPVAPLFRFSTEQEAIEMGNDTEFGLAAYFYSQDVSRCWRVSEALEYGMVGVNEGIVSTEVAPFGGIKQSGFGREGSKYGISEYLNVKYICHGNV